MTTLTVTARGQVTLRKEVLVHLGIEAGGKVNLDLLPNGQAAISAVQSTGTIANFFGLLAEKTQRTATIEDINEIVKQAWSGQK